MAYEFLSFGATGSGEAQQFWPKRYPTAAEYSASLVQAIDAVDPRMSELSAGTQAQFSVLKKYVADVAKMPWAEVVRLSGDASKLAQRLEPIDIAQTSLGLVTGAVNVAQKVASVVGASGQVLAAFSTAASAVAAVAAVAGVVLQVAAHLPTSGEVYQKCRARAHEDEYSQCTALVSRSNDVRATGSRGPTIADRFRPFLATLEGQLSDPWHGSEQAKRRQLWPLSPYAILFALAGQAVNGRNNYFEHSPVVLSDGSTLAPPYPLTKVGYGYRLNIKLSTDTQRRLWALLRNVLAAVEAPGIKPSLSHVPGSGLPAFYAALDLVRAEALKGNIGRDAKEFDYNIRVIANNILHARDWKVPCEYWGYEPPTGSATKFPVQNLSCARYADLATPFITMMDRYQAAVLEVDQKLRRRVDQKLRRRGVHVSKLKSPATASMPLKAVGLVAVGTTAFVLANKLIAKGATS